MAELMANLLKIQRYSINDGPGIRTTIFFKGCPLRCKWCHNPDGMMSEKQLMYSTRLCNGCRLCMKACRYNVHSFLEEEHLVNYDACIKCGECVSACPTGALSLQGYCTSIEDIMTTVLKDLAYYKESKGGVTLSGGEPLMQYEFTIELIKECHKNGIPVCVDTSGYAIEQVFKKVAEIADCFLYDLKMMDTNKHKQYTGVDNLLILENFKIACHMGKEITVRQIVVPEVNDHVDDIKKMADYLMQNNFTGTIELLPYHSWGSQKYRDLGWKYDMEGTIAPTEESLKQIKEYYEKCGLRVKIR